MGQELFNSRNIAGGFGFVDYDNDNEQDYDDDNYEKINYDDDENSKNDDDDNDGDHLQSSGTTSRE